MSPLRARGAGHSLTAPSSWSHRAEPSGPLPQGSPWHSCSQPHLITTLPETEGLKPPALRPGPGQT